MVVPVVDPMVVAVMTRVEMGVVVVVMVEAREPVDPDGFH